MAFMKKLVRDKIPGIMRKEGRRFILRRVEKDELFKYLLEKLQEEVKEFISSQSMEELADILEVIETICRVRGWSWDQILRIKEAKKVKRGGFEEGYIIEVVEE